MPKAGLRSVPTIGGDRAGSDLAVDRVRASNPR
jgi:hypothetical protein